MEIYDAERVFADFCNFAHAWRQCSPFLGNAGQNFGQHAGIFEWLVRASPHRDSFGVRGRRAYVWDQHDGRCGSGVSGLGPRSIRAADGLACQQQIIAATGALASPPLVPSVSEKEAGPARSETRAPARSKTA